MYYEYEYCYEDTVEKNGKFVPTYLSERGIIAADSYGEAMDMIVQDYGKERCPFITLVQIFNTANSLTLEDSSGYSYTFKTKKEKGDF